MATYPDAVGRVVATADYGTNGGSALMRPSTIPISGDTILVNSTVYDDAGMVKSVTDPAAMETRTEYDDAGRRSTVIENYQPASSSSSSSSGGSADGCPASSDVNRETRFTYTADGSLATLTVANSATGDQVTTYTYGTTLSNSAVATSTLLRKVAYPDSTGDSDSIRYTYNRQAQVATVSDQRGGVRMFDYDKLGRPLHDRVTTLGMNVDGAVRRLSSSFDVRGLVEKLTSHDAATIGLGNVVNEVLFKYNDFGQIVISYQEHDGAVDTLTTPKVEFGYASGSANTIRPTRLTYPNGRVLTYSYGTGGGPNDAASRIFAIVDNDASSTHLAEYKYLGIATLVELDYTEPDVKYTMIDPIGLIDPNTGDIYAGFDRFGRVKDSRWYSYALAIPLDVDRIKYGYDRASNRIWRENVVAATLLKDFDELYSYDGLHRLKDMGRGRLNMGHTSLTTKTFAQCWTLDTTGNWSQFGQDDMGAGTWDLQQERAASTVNEITDITEQAGPSWVTPAYDAAGNMTTVPAPADPSTSFTASFDSWNRLVKLADGAETIQVYGYDPRRFLSLRHDYVDGTISDTRHFYYSQRWQCLEERIDVTVSPGSHYVWSAQHPDALVLRDRDSANTGDFDERLYSVIDANRNTTALVTVDGTVQERHVYSAYGVPSFLDGSFNAESSTPYSWPSLFGGCVYSYLSQVYLARLRHYLSGLGTWMQRDVLGYRDSTDLYEYVASTPLTKTDPFGLGSGWNYKVPGDFTRTDYHGLLACRPGDCCPVLIHKTQLWITSGAIRQAQLLYVYPRQLRDQVMTPESWYNHIRELRIVNSHIINCWVLIKATCRDRALPPVPRQYEIPQAVPKPQELPPWVPNDPRNDIWQDIGVCAAIATTVVVGAVAIGAAAGGGTAAGCGGASTLAFPTSAELAAQAAAAGLLLAPLAE